MKNLNPDNLDNLIDLLDDNDLIKGPSDEEALALVDNNIKAMNMTHTLFHIKDDFYVIILKNNLTKDNKDKYLIKFYNSSSNTLSEIISINDISPTNLHKMLEMINPPVVINSIDDILNKFSYNDLRYIVGSTFNIAYLITQYKTIYNVK